MYNIHNIKYICNAKTNVQLNVYQNFWTDIQYTDIVGQLVICRLSRFHKEAQNLKIIYQNPSENFAILLVNYLRLMLVKSLRNNNIAVKKCNIFPCII